METKLASQYCAPNCHGMGIDQVAVLDFMDCELNFFFFHGFATVDVGTSEMQLMDASGPWGCRWE